MSVGDKVSEKEHVPNAKTYKYCFVPDCKNTTHTTPEKIFLSVPRNLLKRKAWCDAVGYSEKKMKCLRYCCEGHFNMKEDLVNFYEWKLMGARKVLKDDALPRVITSTEMDPLASTVKDLSIGMESSDNPIPSTSSCADNSICYPKKSSIARVHCSDQTIKEIKEFKDGDQTQPITFAESIQKLQRRKPVLSVHVEIICDISPSDVSYRAEELPEKKENLNDTVGSISSIASDSSTSNSQNIAKVSTSSEELQLRKEIHLTNIYNNDTKFLIEDDPYNFIGINKDCMFFIDIVVEACSISVKDIYLILRKIKLNESFAVLAKQFSLSERQVGKIFRKYIKILAKEFKSLIVWPSRKEILMNLPAQFRLRFHDICSTIDCFEIEIEQPSNPVHQASTWSAYKKCNTFKYLISVTPDGLINFISQGFSGRTTDVAIVENSGYLDALPAQTSVLADRGFKQLDILLSKKNCKLIRPPSVSEHVKSTEQEVKITKQIASVRVHVERVINRLRNFKFVDIHARVDKNLFNCVDYCVIIAGALVNSQSVIIKEN